jgi:hypothetical protein
VAEGLSISRGTGSQKISLWKGRRLSERFLLTFTENYGPSFQNSTNEGRSRPLEHHLLKKERKEILQRQRGAIWIWRVF